MVFRNTIQTTSLHPASNVNIGSWAKGIAEQTMIRNAAIKMSDFLPEVALAYTVRTALGAPRAILRQGLNGKSGEKSLKAIGLEQSTLNPTLPPQL